MTGRLWTVCSGVVAAGVLAVAVTAQDAPEIRGIFDQADVARNADLTPNQDGVEPLARGPVHEAFIEFARVKALNTPVIAKEPPALIEEMPPAEKPDDDDAQWICGYWAFEDDRDDFLWVSGVWRVPPPDRQWVPGHWSQVDGGWQWVPGFWAPAEDGDVEVVPAPPELPPPDEVPPPPPGVESTYVPGCYVPHANGYNWRPAHYVENRPGWVYVPPHYQPCPTGYIFVEGYWDFALRNRGLLFAPAVISASYRTRPGYVYTPSYVVHDQALISAMFVRQSGGYYFGDYFGAGYQRAGFTSITEVRIGGGYDPLFSYYRYENRGNPLWERDLNGLYAGRRLGSIPPPPRTLAQQQAIAVGFRSGNSSVSLGLVRNSVMIAPVNRVNPNAVRIAQLKQDQLAAHARQVRAQQELVQQRREAQAKQIQQAREARAKQVAAVQKQQAQQVQQRQDQIQQRQEQVQQQRVQAQKLALSLKKQQEARPQAKAPEPRKAPPPKPDPRPVAKQVPQAKPQPKPQPQPQPRPQVQQPQPRPQVQPQQAQRPAARPQPQPAKKPAQGKDKPPVKKPNR